MVCAMTMKRLTFSISLPIALALAAAGPACAEQASPRSLGTFNDWAAYEMNQGDKKICYAISIPEDMSPKTVTRGGVTENINRGQVYVTVSNRPGAKVANEVQISAGYAYQKDSKVSATVDGKAFEMFTQADAAWAYDPQSDRAMVDAMKRGNKLIVAGASSRGTKTRDTYSLSGFTAAHGAVNKACPVR